MSPSDAPLRREIAGIPVAQLAREFGTPTFVYDLEQIEAQIRSLRAFDVVRFAQKANSNLAVLDFCRRAGVLVDAVSAGEVHRALSAGYSAEGDPAPIVYTADIFDREAFEVIAAQKVAVNCGSPEMIEQYAELRAAHPDLSSELTLRINPGFGHGHSQKTNTGGEHSKHGIWHEQLGECVGRAHARGLTIAGIHVHIGSGADMEHLALVSEAATEFARAVGPEITAVSAGGGLPVQYRGTDPEIDVAAYYRIWDAARKQLEADLGHPIRLELEPGRYLVAEAGYLVAEVRAVKRMGENLFVLLDAGFNNLPRPILYGAYHPMSLAPCDDSPRSLQDVVVGGPLCESGDIFTQDEGGFVRRQALPEARVGDHVVIECAGAYAFTMGSNYNSRPFAAEVVVSGGKAQLARERQSVEDLIRGESIPAF